MDYMAGTIFKILAAENGKSEKQSCPTYLSQLLVLVTA